MARLQRSAPAGIPVHLLQRGNNRQACFINNGDYAAYLWWLREYSEKYQVEIHCWALLENHIHLLCTPQLEGGLSSMIQALGRQYVRYFNRRHQRTGTLWEGRYRSCMVQPERYLLEVCRYIELNPARLKSPANPADYNWSSYQNNALGKPSALCRPHAEYLKQGESKAERTAGYRELCAQSPSTKELKEIRDSINKGLAFGDESFKMELEKVTGRRVRALKSGRPFGWRKQK
ncbi:MAG: transposase [SAR324 cluster bacterium]|nr:transposase [SAR324 cluster bacterium]